MIISLSVLTLIKIQTEFETLEVDWSRVGLTSASNNVNFSKKFYVDDKKLFLLAVIKYGLDYKVLES